MTSNMQRNILPDYLINTHNKRNPVLNQWRDLFKDMTFDKNHDFTVPPLEGKEIIPVTMASKYSAFINDSVFMQFAVSWFAYLQSNSHNYVLSSYLSQVLKEASSEEIYYEHFPEKFNAFIKIDHLKADDNNTIIGVFVNIYTNPDTKIKYIAMTAISEESLEFYVDNKLLPAHAIDLFPFKSNYSSIEWASLKVAPGENLLQEVNKLPNIGELSWNGHTDWKKVLYNTLVFITNCNQEMLEKMNLFTGKRSKRDAQAKIYTSLPYVFLDLDKPEKQQHVDITMVKSFWRFQRHGKGNLQIKLKYIKPHVRYYNKTEELHDRL